MVKELSLSEQRTFLLESKPVVILTGDEFGKKEGITLTQPVYVHEVFLKRKLLDGSSNPAHIPATNQGVMPDSLTGSSNPTQSLATNQGSIAKVLQKITSAKFE